MVTLTLYLQRCLERVGFDRPSDIQTGLPHDAPADPGMHLKEFTFRVGKCSVLREVMRAIEAFDLEGDIDFSVDPEFIGNEGRMTVVFRDCYVPELEGS